VSVPEPPRLDTRRAAEFAAELQARARAWMPSWDLADAEGDFGRALLEIAARFSSEVAERLDRAGEKLRNGFLDWLAVRGEAARPARMPVAFKLADAARVAVLAEAPVRLQADASGTSVTFETEKDLRVVPGRVEAIVGVDGGQDAFYLAPPGLTDLSPTEAAPTRWTPKSFVAAGATTVQLDPEGGLAEGTILEAGGQQYRVTKVDKDLVTIEPPLATELSAADGVSKVETFTPFGGTARNWQAHALYFGDSELLNVEAEARIEVIGDTALSEGVAWQYWGKVDPDDAVGWQRLTIVSPDEQKGAKGIVLKKPKGALEIQAIAGRSSRWIRAFRATSDGPITADDFTIRINSERCGPGGLDCNADADKPSPAAEGMANTTPLVLENVFFPLGKEPRQFDAFYLGSKEVFSKPGATVQLCFEMADPKFQSLAVLRSGLLANQVLAGLGADGHLHLLSFDSATPRVARFRNREPLRPPSPDTTGAALPGTPIPLDARPDFRPAIWDGSNMDIYVAVTAGNTVWLWREDVVLPSRSGWTSLGPVDPDADSTTSVRGLVHLRDGTTKGWLFALVDSTLYARNLDENAGAWEAVRTKDGQTEIDFVRIGPVAVQQESFAGEIAEGLVGVDSGGSVYLVDTSGSPPAGACTKVLDSVDPDVTPAAVRRSGDGALVVVAVADGALTGVLPEVASVPSDEAPFDWPDIGANAKVLGHDVDVNVRGGELTFVLCLAANDSTALTAWTPAFSPSAKTPAYTTEVPPGIGTADGAPSLLPQHVIVPTSASEVIVAAFDPSLRATLTTTFQAVVVTERPEDRLGAGDQIGFVSDVDNNGKKTYQIQPIADAGISHGGKAFHAFNAIPRNDELHVYKASTLRFPGTPDSTDFTKLTLDSNDDDTDVGSVLLIVTHKSTALYEVTDLEQDVATLDPALDITNPNLPLDYTVPDDSDAVLRPLLPLNPATNGNWDASLLERTRLRFPGADPEFQGGTAFKVTSGHPELVALANTWTLTPPDLGGGSAQFIVDASVGDWVRQLGDVSTNPELSWEYWNGTGWWTLGPVHDDTLNLKRTGGVTFKVPADLREVDWSGKTNYWMRARLIGGDYGQEKITVLTKDLGGGKTEQTVQRSTDGIRAPSVLKLHITYALCDGVLPAFVLSEDSGSIRDQSDANRTPGAIVEAFVPLAVMLGRLSGPQPPATGAEECPPECPCGGAIAASGSTREAAIESTATTAVSLASERALLIGVDAPLVDAPVNVLFLVDERDHSSFAPMRVEALIADRFQPIVADDATRALGESDVLSMAFAVQPAPRELFGRTLTWLRLSPAPRQADTGWQPTVRGVYLNAVWASATETLTRELLGSSEGAPNITVSVARPPVLHDTLELRVREPLSDEERDELRQTDPRRVLSAPDDLPGDWVLWHRVIDPLDEAPTARVYALEESNGIIRFGDGLHGRIPPIGRDSIVAFSYKRTEPGAPGSPIVPANTIVARTPLNLVSPVESVEAVIAADQAAGGAPPEPDERVLRFGFARMRHRGRVVSARDLEDLALESSPDIVQARAFTGSGFARLVIVMKGRNPRPTGAQVRELRRLLLASAPASLSAPKALRISGPRPRQLRIDLRLRIERLEYAGALGEAVKQRLAAYFDTGTGGTEKQGWPLGANPSEEDIALALIDAPKLDGIAGVRLLEAIDQGRERQWPASLKPTDIVVLASDPVRIQFETAEVLA
jgi:hypothetical protein